MTYPKFLFYMIEIPREEFLNEEYTPCTKAEWEFRKRFQSGRVYASVDIYNTIKKEAFHASKRIPREPDKIVVEMREHFVENEQQKQDFIEKMKDKPRFKLWHNEETSD